MDKEGKQKERQKREKREKEVQIIRQVKYLYSKRQLEALILLALTLVPDDKFVSRKFILLLLDVNTETYPTDSHGIMMTLSRLARSGLIESYSLLRYKMTEGRKKLESFVQNSVLGTVVTVGNCQTQSVFRLTEEGRKKLTAYLKGGILNDMPLTPEEKLLTAILD